MANYLAELYQSTVELHERFNTSQTVQQSLELFTEEYTETLNEVPTGNKERLTEEFVDTLVTTIGVFRSIVKSENNLKNLNAMFLVIKKLHELYLVIRKNDISNEQLEKSFEKVINKNNAKTLETHTLDHSTGKIKRVSR